MDEHSEMILDQYREAKPTFDRMQGIVVDVLKQRLGELGLITDGIGARIKTEKSLAGKLELKGLKYHSLSDITDILGARVVVFYSDEVDQVAQVVRDAFEIDWDNSIDKRKALDPDQFGYLSLHYICRIPETLFRDDAHPELNEYRFEIQMRTALQHVWASVEHDTGYKSDIEVPSSYIRRFSRLAGLLELADDEFLQIRNDIDAYRESAEALIGAGHFDQVSLDGDTFKRYLDTNPFGELAARIAKENGAELYKTSEWPYLFALKQMGMETLADIEVMRDQDADDACRLIARQLERTDIDILSSTVALHNLCLVHIIKLGAGEADVRRLLEAVYGERRSNASAARRILAHAHELGIRQTEDDA